MSDNNFENSSNSTPEAELPSFIKSPETRAPESAATSNINSTLASQSEAPSEAQGERRYSRNNGDNDRRPARRDNYERSDRNDRRPSRRDNRDGYDRNDRNNDSRGNGGGSRSRRDDTYRDDNRRGDYRRDDRNDRGGRYDNRNEGRNYRSDRNDNYGSDHNQPGNNQNYGYSNNPTPTHPIMTDDPDVVISGVAQVQAGAPVNAQMYQQPVDREGLPQDDNFDYTQSIKREDIPPLYVKDLKVKTAEELVEIANDRYHAWLVSYSSCGATAI